ncbi:MAG: GDPmannose 4,6-dehydratase [Parcubacteria group bacterium Gr01-1014_33]|nr:MAG: GDPmannose 4,6-dehydratase [Parcubacteria group bacterium Gr01-1014_33]
MSKNKKTALITGVTGQDGSYLAEFLLRKEYRVFGLVESGKKEQGDIPHVPKEIPLLSGDLRDEESISRAIAKVTPDEVYNLAAQSSSTRSFEFPLATADINGLGPVRILESIRKYAPRARFFQASSAEIFGIAERTRQNENTPPRPFSPYGAAKLYADAMVSIYRERYGMFAVSGILFNHESPRRGLEFVTRKITSTAVNIKLGHASELRLGNLDTKRDWGFAGDYVKAMWAMLQQKKPKNYVIATGELHSVREFVKKAFSYLGLDWKKYTKVDPQFIRAKELYPPCGDACRARKELRWKPQVSFKELVQMMVDADMEQEMRPQKSYGKR